MKLISETCENAGFEKENENDTFGPSKGQFLSLRDFVPKLDPYNASSVGSKTCRYPLLFGTFHAPRFVHGPALLEHPVSTPDTVACQQLDGALSTVGVLPCSSAFHG